MPGMAFVLGHMPAQRAALRDRNPPCCRTRAQRTFRKWLKVEEGAYFWREGVHAVPVVHVVRGVAVDRVKAIPSPCLANLEVVRALKSPRELLEEGIVLCRWLSAGHVRVWDVDDLAIAVPVQCNVDVSQLSLRQLSSRVAHLTLQKVAHSRCLRL